MTYESDIDRTEPAAISEPALPRLISVLQRVKNAYKILTSNSLLLSGTLILLVTVLAVACAGWISHANPILQSLSHRVEPPSAEHWFGTDQLGRDMLSRVLYGGRATLIIVLFSALAIAPVGLLVGILAGYYGGVIDTLFMRITDIFFAFPRLVLALALSAVLGAGLFNAVFAIVISAWPPYARQARAEVLTIMEMDFIKAARLSGASDMRIIVHYILPLCASSAFIRLALDLSGIIIIAAGLGFLGLGIQPPTPEWGAMISEGRQYISTAWWISLFPGLSILLMSAAFTLLGDGLRDTFDPKKELSQHDQPTA